MFEILLMGLAVIGVYLLSHLLVTRLEAWSGRSLGIWRTVLFFCVFLTLILAVMAVVPKLLGPAHGS